jgi:hypothetical protein
MEILQHYPAVARRVHFHIGEKGASMKNRLRDKSPTEGRALEQVFGDFEVMAPTGGERRTRKPAKSTLASADTKGQKDAATRARKTATPTNARVKK